MKSPEVVVEVAARKTVVVTFVTFRVSLFFVDPCGSITVPVMVPRSKLAERHI